MDDNNNSIISRSQFLKITGGLAAGMSLIGYIPYHIFDIDIIRDKSNLNSIEYEKVGKGICKVESGNLQTKNAYAALGDSEWSDYEVEFDARVPISADEVQIWAGFRASGRYDRYVLGLKGGIQNDIYLARLGYMGTDDFLALREADFPIETGKYYAFKIQVVGNRIRVFLNNESVPRIDIMYKYSSLASNGKIALGGSWIENDFTNISIRPLPANTLSNVPMKEYTSPLIDKGAKRKWERSMYTAVNVNRINKQRTTIPLGGKWLFKPAHEIDSQRKAISPNETDYEWHILTVPNFWNPNRIWLYGEQYKSASRGTSDSYYQKETDRCRAYTFDYKKTDIGWYRQWINLPHGIENKHLELHFDAVSKSAEVWINGKKAGNHIGMFGDFKIDGTDLLNPGQNLLVVKVYKKYKNIEGSNQVVSVAASEKVTQEMLKKLPHDIYNDNPAGIWQPVSLVITGLVKVQDIFIEPDLQGAIFGIKMQNYTNTDQTFSLHTHIESVGDENILYKELSIKDIKLSPGEQEKVNYAINGLNPKPWSPAHPNLYNFYFSLIDNKLGTIIDQKIVRSGFKTFEVKNGYFYLNNKRYWLRGANQTSMPLEPNDEALARRFCKLMHEGNINVTRTHTAPYTEVWMNASDENGIGISYEGVWPWMMIGDSPIPDKDLLDIWKKEFFSLIKKYRNHPSLLMWTVNNEMHFYVNDPDTVRAKKKMRIISDAVKQIRQIDPVHPIIFSSNYSHKQSLERFGSKFMKGVDDGDVDDIHYYPNWYEGSIFDEFNGEFQKKHKYEGRPLISQEMSTGYPDETGHCTRSYTFVDQTPQALIGKYSYAFKDPAYFLDTNAFITKEVAEALRRTNEKAAGILHFSLSTWFKSVYSANTIKPFPTYYAIKKALQPILVSAELWGRHFYAGEQLSVRICVVNDQEIGEYLPQSILHWRLIGEKENLIKSGSKKIPAVRYYGREWIPLNILIPSYLPKNKLSGKLELKLTKEGDIISENDYELLFATKNWPENNNSVVGKKLIVVDLSGKVLSLLKFLKISYSIQASVRKALQQRADVYIFSGFNFKDLSSQEIHKLRVTTRKGAKVLWLNGDQLAQKIYPEYIRGVITANSQIMTMDIPESPVFDDISPLDTRYFNDSTRTSPTVCRGAFQINRHPNVNVLASSEKVHVYLSSDINKREQQVDQLRGFPIIKINDHKGMMILSTVMVEKGITDPVAAKLFTNMINCLLG